MTRSAKLAQSDVQAHLWTRRRMLKTLFCSSALLAMNLDVRKLSAADIAAADDLHWLAIGDFGSASKAQTQVAKMMAGYLKQLEVKPTGLLLLGDNFYGKMPGGLKSERWESGFEKMYPKSVFDCPCPAVLGNHDYRDQPGNNEVQVAYTKTAGTRWKMPHPWYRMDVPGKDGKPLVTFLFIDTNLPSVKNELGAPAGSQHWPTLKPSEADEQWKWIRTQLAADRAPWTICIGHHPVYSNGQHGDTKGLVDDLAPLLQEHGVQLYLCGHDHDMQHLELEGLKTSFVVSGGGGAGVRELKNKERPAFGLNTNGFTHMHLNAQRFVIRHFNEHGEQIHAFEKKITGEFKVLSA
ncbi:MAG: acid phosphatase [Planctomycetes bacterium]|nr:acid phosphatase [Planctomycetota bacterium]